MKYRNTFKSPTRKGRAALLLLALAAALFALHGAHGTRGVSAQEKARKSSRATPKLDELRGTQATAAAKRSRKPAKAGNNAAAWGEAASLVACTAAGQNINFGQNISGSLTLDDCDFGDSTRFDIYNFEGTAGQQISITMNSSAFDAYLFLVYDADGSGTFTTDDFEVGEDDDGATTPNNTSSNSRMPSGGGVGTLPFSGRYFIIANAFPPTAGNPVPTGAYALSLTLGAGQCAAAGSITAGVALNGSLGSPGCRFIDDSFYDAYSFSGTQGQQISVTLNSTYDNSGQAVVYLLDASREVLLIEGGDSSTARVPATGLVTLPASGTYYVVAGSTPRADTFSPTPTGSYTLTVTSGGRCPTSRITAGQTVNGSLAGGDCVLPDGTLADFYTFRGLAGQQVAVAMSSTDFDTYLFLNRPDGTTLAENDDGGSPSDTDSRIPLRDGFITLPATGTYTILANSFPDSPPPTGAYTLTLTQQAAAPSDIQFSAASYTVTEGVERTVIVTVTRTGDTTGESFVSYATLDGTASERKDYTAALGRVRFAPGQSTKTFEIVITDDAFAEGQETFTVTLGSPAGSTLGAITSAVVNINSNDIADGISPVRDAAFNTEFFVRQHYADFLNRVPDPSGLAFWMANIDSCQNEQCREVRKVNVSAAFFLAIEFQETGFLAVRTHKVAYGNLPPDKPVPLRLRDFLFDSRQIGEGVVVGEPGWPEQLEANKVAYFNEFVEREGFIAVNSLTLTAEQYVNKLFGNAGVPPTQAERTAAINAFNNSGRAAALRSVAESASVKAAETNRAFVLMQYFGYLRRNPDDTDFRGVPDPSFEGYKFWLGKLDQFNGNYEQAEMVKAFITSIEYGDRFGR